MPVKATHAKPVEEVGEISAITYGFMASKALFAAVEFDLFTHIARGADGMSALEQATGIAENRLVTLLTALKSLGLITEHDGRLINAPATARYLVAGAPGDFRDYVRLVNGAFGRLDRLGPAKEVAQIGAAIGREFSHPLLAAVAGKPEAELQSTLDRLVEAGLLFRQGVPPQATYLFNHALVQDAAYGTLLREPGAFLNKMLLPFQGGTQ
jgi:hypothetical protein